MASIVYPSLPSGAAATSDPQFDTNGIQFSITGSGYQLAGYYIYVPSAGTTTGSSYSFGLYSTTNGTTGTLITAASLTGSGTLTAGAWNYLALGSPVALTSGTTYVAVFQVNPNVTYMYVHSFWTTGGGGASGITSGPVTAPNSASALGGFQQPYAQPSSSGLVFPAAAYLSSWYGIDINVTSSAVNATVPLSSALTGSASLPAPQPGTLTGPAYASAQNITAVAGAGTWANPGNATGGPDGTAAVWAVV
jgi:hypothetical protein